MLKTTIPSLIALLCVVAAVLTIISGTSAFTTALEQDAQESLRRSANVAEQAVRLEEASLLAKASFVGQGDTLYQAMKGEIELPEDQRPDEISFEEERHLVVHDKLTAQKYKLDDIAAKVKGRRNLELGPLERTPHDYDVFIALDDTGVGVAALGKNLFSWFGSDVSKTFPSVKEVLKTGETRIEHWNWSFSGDDKRVHRVALAPIRRAEKEEIVGVVVVGYMLGDGAAKTQQKLLAGVSEDSNDQEVLDRAPDIVLFQGKQVVGSTFDTSRQSAVAAELDRVGGFSADAATIFELSEEGKRYLAMVRPIAGSGENAMGVAVMADLTHALKPVKSLQVTLALIFGLMLLLGVGASIFLIVRWMAPLERLEIGIQEVIAGNKDHVWEPLKNHDLHEGLAQGLNLMSAYLQGKPMPDDENAGQSWSADELDSTNVGGPAPKVQGVSLPMMQAPPPKDNEDSEA